MKNETIAKLVKGGLALGGLAIGAIVGTFVKAAPEEADLELDNVTENAVVEIPAEELQDI